MSIYYSAHFLRRVKRRVKKNPGLRKKIAKQVKLLQEDPSHPSLKLHKLEDKRVDEYAFWIEGNLRITFVKDNGDVVLTDIITHDEY